jgi:RHS repeat-associated protein
MRTAMQKIYFSIFIILISFVSIAQEKETLKTAPVEQPKANPTAKEQKPPTPIIDKKDDGGKGDGDGKDPKDTDPKDGKTSSLTGGQADGTSPTASPETAFQNKLLDIPVNTFTGTASVPIPLYTLNEGNISVPIALSHNASGVKAHEVAAWTGMNTTISAGAFLSKIVRGIPDEGKLEYTTYGSNSSSTRKGFYQHGLKADNDGNNDSEPDLYLLNINGASYKFTFGSVLFYDPIALEYYRKAVFFPDADIAIRVSYQHYIPWGETAINTNIGRFVNWQVILPHGVIYTFAGTPETIEATFEVEAKTAQIQNIYQEESGQPIGADEILRYAKNNKVTSAWYVTKVESPFGNHIDFSYLPSKYSFFKLAEQETQTNNCTFFGMSQAINKVFVQSSILSRIASQTITVLFNKETYTCVVNPNKGQENEPDSLCKIQSGNITRSDIDGWQKYPRGSQYYTGTNTNKVLNNMAVVDNNTGKSLNWTFEYENKVSTGQDNDPIIYNYSYNEVGNTHINRFFLRKIILPDNNFYRLSYSTFNYSIPSRLTKSIDHWGYFSSTSYNAGLIGRDYTRPCASVGTSRDTENSGTYAQYYALDSLISSTGTVIKFTYDNHEAQNFTGKIGGSRIRQIENIDLISGIRTIRTYDYLQLSSLASSGFIALKPIYHFTDLNDTEQWNSGIYAQLLGQLGKPAVGYSRVVEKTITPSFVGNNNLGSTVTEYNQDLVETNLVISGASLAYTVRPWQNHFYHDYSNGVPLSVKTYNNNGIIITEKISSYDYGTSDNLPISGYKSFRLNGINYNFQESYTESLTKFRLKSETVKAYNQAGTNPVENTSTLTYKDEMSSAYKATYKGKHNQVVKTESIDSYGYANETFNKYAFDFDFGNDSTRICQTYDPMTGDCLDSAYFYTNHIPTNAEAKGVWQLQQKKMGATIVETYTKKNENIVAANCQNFYDIATTEHQSALGKESYIAQNLPLTTITEIAYNRATEGFVKDPNYDLKTTIEKYNPLGMPKVVQTRFGARDSTVFDATNTLVLEQHNNIKAYDKNRTKMEYNTVLFGVSKVIATNDLSVQKDYYDNGKLKQTKDKDGNILKHYQYYYRGQNDADPYLNTGSTHNRIITRIPRIATTDALNLDYQDCIIFVTYSDGAGRILQKVSYKASPNKKDMISDVTLFDEFGRPNKSILPIESNYDDGRYTHCGILDIGDGVSKYPNDYVANVQSVIQKARIFYNDDAPYTSIAEYENSPLSRAFKTYGVGKAWRDNLKFTEVKYETATGIKKFTVLHNSTTVTVGTYSGYVLTKKILIDERGSLMVEYTDKSGNIIQKDVQVDGTAGSPVFLSTAYIFDDTGNIRYILNPKAYNLLSVLSSFDETNPIFDANVYSYVYDGRFRVKSKHKPGVGTNKVIYNRLNQVCLSQDSQEALTNTWNYVKLDGQGRSTQSGQLINTNSASTIQGYFDSFTASQQFEERSTASGNVQQYTNRAFPSALNSSINDASLKTVAYFDDYLWRYSNPYSGSIADYGFQTNPFNASAYSATNATGLGTGGLTKIEIFGDFLFPAVIYLDDKNRSTQSINYHNLLARNQSDVQYNFIGEVLQNRMIYRKQGASDHIRTIEQTLDHIGRAKEMFYTLKEGTVNKVARMKMVELFHDNIGRLKTKIIEPIANTNQSKQTGLWTDVNTWLKGMLPTINDAVVISQGHIVTVPTNQIVTAGSLYNAGGLEFKTNSKLQFGTLSGSKKAVGLQVLEYRYNVRGQIRGVNLDANENPKVSQDKLFSEKIDYHEDGRYFDGSISKQSWLSYAPPSGAGGLGLRSYLLSYDLANRLTNAQYSGVGNENYSVSQSYDVNGNIQNLQRNSKTGANTWGLVDNLTYGYFGSSDKLKKVDDAITGNVYANDFRNIIGDDYDYTVDGKLTKDNNKGITDIQYNFLDLVKEINFSDGRKVEYSYTSTGVRRQRKVTKNGVTNVTLYDGEMVYTYTGTNSSPLLNNFAVSEIQNSEGRFVNGKLEYSYTDHIGNLRLSYKDSLGVAVVTQSQSYDPWSNINAGSEYYLSGNQGDKYLVCGKESDTESGNILLDWRDYDSVTGRMNSYDPEDASMSVSGFAYCMNNPVSLNDPDGRNPIVIGALIGAGISALTYTASVSMSEGGFNNWNWGSFAKSVGIGALSGALSAGVGQAYGGIGDFGHELARAFTHAIVQTNVSAFTGGDPSSAFFSAFIGSGVGSASSGLSGGVQLGISAVSGAGISTAISGGNFWENLAVSTVVVGVNHLFHQVSAPPQPTKSELELLAYAGVLPETQLLKFGISMSRLRLALGTIGLVFLVESDNPYYVYEITGMDKKLVAKFGVTQQTAAENRPQSQIKGIDEMHAYNAPHKWRWILERTTPSIAFATEKYLVWNYWMDNNQMPYAQIYPGTGAWLKLLNKSKKK